MADRIRMTVSIDPEALAVYRSMADSAGISLSRCLGDWLADTADGAQLVAAKMQEAKKAPVAVMRELQAMLHGAQGEASNVLEQLRLKNVRAAVPDTARRPTTAPSSNTGLKSPPRDRGRRG